MKKSSTWRNGPPTRVFEASDEGLAVGGDSLDDGVALELEDGEVGHGLEDVDHGGVLQAVLGEVENAGGDEEEESDWVTRVAQAEFFAPASCRHHHSTARNRIPNPNRLGCGSASHRRTGSKKGE